MRRGGLHPVLSDGIAVRHGELMLEGAVADPGACDRPAIKRTAERAVGVDRIPLEQGERSKRAADFGLSDNEFIHAFCDYLINKSLDPATDLDQNALTIGASPS